MPAVTKVDVPIVASVRPRLILSVRGSAGVNYTVSRHRLSGTLTEETTIVRTGGAHRWHHADQLEDRHHGELHLFAAVRVPADRHLERHHRLGQDRDRRSASGAAARCRTIDEIWVDLEYLGDASSPQGSFVNDGKADLLTAAANQTSSSATWGGSTTKFKLDVTFTAQQKGWVYARVKVAKASSTFYIDPLVTLT